MQKYELKQWLDKALCQKLQFSCFFRLCFINLQPLCYTFSFSLLFVLFSCLFVCFYINIFPFLIHSFYIKLFFRSLFFCFRFFVFVLHSLLFQYFFSPRFLYFMFSSFLPLLRFFLAIDKMIIIKDNKTGKKA